MTPALLMSSPGDGQLVRGDPPLISDQQLNAVADPRLHPALAGRIAQFLGAGQAADRSELITARGGSEV